MRHYSPAECRLSRLWHIVRVGAAIVLSLVALVAAVVHPAAVALLLLLEAVTDVGVLCGQGLYYT